MGMPSNSPNRVPGGNVFGTDTDIADFLFVFMLYPYRCKIAENGALKM